MLYNATTAASAVPVFCCRGARHHETRQRGLRFPLGLRMSAPATSPSYSSYRRLVHVAGQLIDANNRLRVHETLAADAVRHGRLACAAFAHYHQATAVPLFSALLLRRRQVEQRLTSA